jgi:outer membrane biosynthesis protein TonB
MKHTALPVALLVLMTSCIPWRRTQMPAPPPRTIPARIPDQVSTADAPPPKNLPAPPPMPAEPVITRSDAAAMIPKPPQSPPQTVKPAPRKRQRVRPVPMPEERADKATEEPLPRPAWKLGQVMSTAERDALKKEADAMISAAAKAVATAETRTLSAAQSEFVNRIKVFSQQAKEALETDPMEARNLAARAKTFADALLADLR